MNGLGRKKEESENKNLVFTRETFGVVLVLFATLCLVCLITRENVFAGIGLAVNSFLLGCFGFFAYAVIIAFAVLGVMLICGTSSGISFKRKALITGAFLSVAIIAHVATLSSNGYDFAGYLSESYAMGAGGISTTSAGGIFTAVIAYAFSALLTDIGSYVVLGVIIAIIAYALVKDVVSSPSQNSRRTHKVKIRSSYEKEEENELGIDIAGTKEYPVEDVNFAVTTGKQRLFVNNPEEFAVKNKREIQKESNKPTSGIKLGFAEGGLGVVTMGAEPAPMPSGGDFKKKLDYVKTPATIDMDRIIAEQKKNQNPVTNGTSVSGYVANRTSQPETSENRDIPFIEHGSAVKETNENDSLKARAEAFGSRYADVVETDQSTVPSTPEQVFRPIDERPSIVEDVEDSTEEIPFIEETEQEKPQDVTSILGRTRGGLGDIEIAKEEEPTIEPEIEQPSPSNVTRTRGIRNIFGAEETAEEKKDYTSRVEADNNGRGIRDLGFTPETPEEPIPEEEPKKETPPINREYFRPPLDLLETYTQPINTVQENHAERMEIIQRTLEEFHINAVPQSYIQGPSVTRYEIMMPAGISVRKVLNYDDDLKMRLAAKDGVRIEAPIPGKNLVGIEVANSVKVTVGLKEVMEGLAGKKSKPTALMFAVGKDIVGNSISYDLAKGPHYLIAGATGSGKSVALHVMIVSLLMRYSPEELKLVLVDPKSVEFRKYEHIPHLLVDEIVTEPKRALTLLQWAYDETNRRNEMFTACGGMISNIDDYNTQIASDTIPKLPRIVFVIDELADLMEACKKDLEQRIRMIAAKSRSAGIHLVLATQRPSVDVITGTIKANLPSRIALKVMNFADSQTILGEAGAEKLLGNGDMLYKDSSMGDYERYQGAYISGREVTNIVNYIKDNNKAYFDDDVKDFLEKETSPKQEESVSVGGASDENNGPEMNDLMLKALWLGVNTQSMSIALLQRRFQIGYARAGGLVDKLERMGYVSGNEGSKARRVLMTKEEFISKFGPIEDD